MTAATTRSSTRSSVLGSFLTSPLPAAAAILLLIIVFASILAPLLTPLDPNTAVIRDAYLPPFSPDHLLGTDSAGRDVWARLLYGGRTSLLGAALALVVAAAIGIPGGLLAGYYGGWFDNVSVWTTNLVQSLPGIVVLLAARSVMGPSIWFSMLIFGVILSPGFYRVVRTSVVNVRNELYVDAARVAGLRDASIIGRHVLTVVRAPIIIQASLLLGIALAIQSGLEFLGVGDNALPSWGNMLNEGFRNIYRDPVSILWPALAIGLTCAALVIVGNGLRDALEERGLRTGRVRRARRAEASATDARVDVPVGPVTAASDTPEQATPDAGAGLGPAAAPPVAPVTGPPDPSAVLSVRDLAVSYGAGRNAREVVRDVSLDVRPGEVLGLVGESGSGKTQTAFAVLDLLSAGGRISAGSVRYLGEELTTMSRSGIRALRGTGIAYIPQEPMSNLDPSFTIGSQLATPMMRRLKIGRAEARTRSLDLLRRVGIRDPQRTFDAYPHEISGGMAQRVLIAGAVSCGPRLLIADEPTTALDVTVQAEVLALLRDLQAESGMAVILVTHNFGVVADICDRVAVMNAGTIVETNDVLSIFRDPQHPYTRMLLDSTLEGGPSRTELDALEGGR